MYTACCWSKIFQKWFSRGGQTSGSPWTKGEGMVGEVEEEKAGRGTLRGCKSGEITGQCLLHLATARSDFNDFSEIYLANMNYNTYQ